MSLLDEALTAAENPWFSWEYVRSNAGVLRAALGEHVRLTATTILLAGIVGIPLGVLAHRVRWLTAPILSLSGILYTIPSVALFAFLAPLPGFGVLKDRTVLVGLTMYALLVVVRNTLTGLVEVPGEVRDAARGMGYGRLAMLTRIDLPLALPGILTGIRIATVSTVALVTVGVVVGVGGLGTLIFAGFQNNFYKAQIMTATLLCVGLAIILDVLLAGASRMLTPWSRR